VPELIGVHGSQLFPDLSEFGWREWVVSVSGSGHAVYSPRGIESATEGSGGTGSRKAIVVPPRHLNTHNLPSDPPPDKPKREDFPTPEAYEAALQKWMIAAPPPQKPVSQAPAPLEADQSPLDSGVTREVRKRGRSEIPADRKEEVAKLMADAAARDEQFSRKEAAKILYKTDNPTASQRRNAANIMKYYLKSRDKK
jgi:hypothetical protein